MGKGPHNLHYPPCKCLNRPGPIRAAQPKVWGNADSYPDGYEIEFSISDLDENVENGIDMARFLEFINERGRSSLVDLLEECEVSYVIRKV